MEPDCPGDLIPFTDEGATQDYGMQYLLFNKNILINYLVFNQLLVSTADADSQVNASK